MRTVSACPARIFAKAISSSQGRVGRPLLVKGYDVAILLKGFGEKACKAARLTTEANVSESSGL